LLDAVVDRGSFVPEPEVGAFNINPPRSTLADGR
jgi:hypothetical protein